MNDHPATSAPSRLGTLFLGLLLGGAAGAGALYFAGQKPTQAVAPLVPPAPASLAAPAIPEVATTAPEEAPVQIVHEGLPRTPFEKGNLPAEEAVETIKITLGVGTDGAALNEPVDVHLGLGFPLRLYPLGGLKREPSFAAFPSKSSLQGMAVSIEPGKMATFEFSAKDNGQGLDVLETSRQLLAGVKCGDLQRLGIASQGRTDWVLAGYRIEVNGKLLAANGTVDARPQEKLATSREKLMKILPDYDAKTRKPDLTDKEKAELQTEHILVRALSGRVVGAVPWYEEDSFKPAALQGTPVETVRISLSGSAGPQQGTRNPLYLQVGGKKFLLTSEADPLQDTTEPQLYDLAPFELALNPLSREALKLPGIGVLGSGMPAHKLPDRAQLQRVAVWADGQPVYDSEQQPVDQATLPRLWLTPTAHLDEKGNVVHAIASATEVPLWLAGTNTPSAVIPVPAEPPPPAVIVVLPPPPLLPPVRYILPGGLPPPGGGFFPLLDVLAHLLLPLPPPAAPLISGVRVAPSTPIVRDGDAVNVNWTVGGSPLGIASWRVDLFAVLPHKPAPVLATPLATAIGIPAGATSAFLPPLNRANVAALLAPGSAEALYLYVQPRVTALDILGNVITSANGSLLPLFPAGTTTASVSLRRGGVLPPLGFGNAAAPSFQVTPAVPPAQKWASMPLADPLAVRQAWSLTAEHGSHFGLLFASHENIPSITLPSWSTAARPTGDGAEMMTFRFEGFVPIPAGANGYRAVAHLGFVGGSAPATTGTVLARAELSSGPIRRGLGGAVMPPPFGAQPFFTLQTALAPLPLSKATPLVLVDMPLRFDRMSAASFGTYPLDPVNAAAYAVPPLSAATFGFNAPAFNAQALGGTMYVTLTFMVKLTTADLTDAVGVMGVRLVPDNTP